MTIHFVSFADDQIEDDMAVANRFAIENEAVLEPHREHDRDGMSRRSTEQRGKWSCSVKPGPQLAMGRCQLNSETIPWPRGHKPTPNGGRVGEKQGRIASYLAPEPQQPAVGEREEWTQEQVNNIIHNQTKYADNSPTTNAYALPSGQDYDDDELVQSIDVLSLYGVLQPPNITQATIIELKSMREPPQKVQQVLHCVAILLGVRHDTWYECRDMVSSDDFRAQLLMMDIGRLNSKQVQIVKNITAQPEFVPELMAKVSPVAAELLGWVSKAVQIFQLIEASAGTGTSATHGALSSTDRHIDPSMTVTHQNFGFVQ